MPTPELATLPFEALVNLKQRIRRSRGDVIGGNKRPGHAEPGHPYFWAAFVYVGAIPGEE